MVLLLILTTRIHTQTWTTYNLNFLNGPFLEMSITNSCYTKLSKYGFSQAYLGYKQNFTVIARVETQSEKGLSASLLTYT